MDSGITVRAIDPEGRPRLKREARQAGVRMEEFDRRPIRGQRTNTEHRPNPSAAFAQHFGMEHGVDLPASPRCGYRPVSFSGEGGA